MTTLARRDTPLRYLCLTDRLYFVDAGVQCHFAKSTHRGRNTSCHRSAVMSGNDHPAGKKEGRYKGPYPVPSAQAAYQEAHQADPLIKQPATFKQKLNACFNGFLAGSR